MKVLLSLLAVISVLGASNQAQAEDYPCLRAAKQVRIARLVYDNLLWVLDSRQLGQNCNNDRNCILNYQAQYNQATVALRQADQNLSRASIAPLDNLRASQHQYESLRWVTNPAELGRRCNNERGCIVQHQDAYNRSTSALIDSEEDAIGCK